MIVLDTNVISEPMNPRPNPKVVNWLDAQSESDIWLTSITVAELRAGLAKLQPGAKHELLAEKIDRTLRDFQDRILPFGQDAAFVYGDLVGPMMAKKAIYKVLDYQIASIVLVNGGTLATRNTRDFMTTGVPLIDPWTA